MGDLIMEIRKLDSRLRKREHHLVGPAALTIGTIHGGSAINLVANACKIGIDRRFLPDETDATIMKEFEEIFQELKLRNEHFKSELKHTLTFPGMEISQEEPIVKVLSQAIKEVRGEAPEIGGKLGGTDASWIYHRLGIPMVHFAPGETNKGGTSDEMVKTQDLIDATKIYALTIMEMLNRTSANSLVQDTKKG
jgi:acetylornithine deacetylase